MMTVCKCGSHAINHHCHGRDGTDGDLCDVCYWRKRAEQPVQQALDKMAENARELGLDYEPAQPAREWVGLTQEEIDLVWDSVPETQFWWRHYGQAIEAKLKEKNT